MLTETITIIIKKSITKPKNWDIYIILEKMFSFTSILLLFSVKRYTPKYVCMYVVVVVVKWSFYYFNMVLKSTSLYRLKFGEHTLNV